MQKLSRFEKILLGFRRDSMAMEWGKAVKRVKRRLDAFYKTAKRL